MALQGGGNAMVATVLLCMLLLHFDIAQAATYIVGDSGGWSFNVSDWTKGKRFEAGDILIFNYNPSIHNVVAVSKAGYDTCTTPEGAKVFNSGRDQIKLVKGENYFICSFPGHCQGGMKIAVTTV